VKNGKKWAGKTLHLRAMATVTVTRQDLAGQHLDDKFPVMHRVKRNNIILGAGRILDLYGCIRPARQMPTYRSWHEDASRLRQDGALITKDLRVAYERVCVRHGLAPGLVIYEALPADLHDEILPDEREPLACG
jgi:hypothetical protein